MKKIKDLEASDFPGVDEKKFYEWKQRQKNASLIGIIGNLLSLILIIVLGLIYGAIATIVVLIMSRVILYFISHNYSRLTKELEKELGITPESIKAARQGVVVKLKDKK